MFLRSSALPAFACLCLAAIPLGCGTGSGNGSGGTPPGPAPVLTSLSPSSAVSGSSEATVTAAGANFTPTSSVEWNGAALATTYMSPTTLVTQIPAADLGSVGDDTITVTDDSGTSGGLQFAVISNLVPGETIVNVNANDLAWDPVNQVIYLSLPSSDGANGNSVQVLNPSTGTLGISAFAGSEPNLLSVSKNSKYLYVSMNGASSVQRMTLPSLGMDIAIPLGINDPSGPYYAIDLQAAPNYDGTVAIARGTPSSIPAADGGIVIYDDGIARPDAPSNPYRAIFDSIQWNSDGTELFTANNETTSFDFCIIPVTFSGLGNVADYQRFAGGLGDELHYDRVTTYVYDDYGFIIDPNAVKILGTFPASGLMVPDGSLGRAFFLGQVGSDLGSTTYTLGSFDIHTLAAIATMKIVNVIGTPSHLIRWGSNGLAFTTESSSGSSSPTGAVYLISGSFVDGTSSITPPASNPNPAPTLAAVEPISATVGSATIVVTVTGNNFIPTSTVYWNDAPLTTAYVSSTSLTAEIPTSELQSSGADSITVINPAPGGGSSGAVNFAVNPPMIPSPTVVKVQVNSLAWDPVNQVIYLSLPSADGANGNTVQVLDPVTGILGAAVYIGSEPDLLAVSRNSRYLYVSLDGTSSVQRMTLPNLGTDITIPLGSSSLPGVGNYYAMDLQTSPADDGTVAVVRRGAPEGSPEEEGGVVIYDDGTARPESLCGFGIQPGNGCTGIFGGVYASIQWNSDGSEMFAANNEDTGFDFYNVPVTSAGFGTVTDYIGVTKNAAESFGSRIHFDPTTKYIYGDDGSLIDPIAGTRVGTFNASGLMVPDGSIGKAFFIGQTPSQVGSTDYTIESFDINRLTPIAEMTIPDIGDVPTQIIRWGNDGLAVATPATVYLIQSSFVNESARKMPAENVHRTWK